MMQFIDWLWYSDAGQKFAKWGVEGTTYTGSVADGTFKLEPNVNWSGLNPNAKTSITDSTASTTACSPTAAPPS